MQELAFIRTVLSDSGDAKNYHAWGHRQWVLRTFGGWEAELAYVEELLQQDLRNNSAWNQRFYVLQSSQDLKQLDVVRGEVAYALRCGPPPPPHPPPPPPNPPPKQPPGGGGPPAPRTPPPNPPPTPQSTPQTLHAAVACPRAR
jgi:hypothetical protein